MDDSPMITPVFALQVVPAAAAAVAAAVNTRNTRS
tara:strand:+ start:836 stop:940 length:105 start_codon:yes stop_codon:yes gene_type:complete